MKNAHLRFGWLTYVKSTEKTTTSIKLRLDRFIGEVLPDPPRQAKAHLISVIGGDTQISAVSGGNFDGRPFHGGRAGRTANSSMPGAECAVFQRLPTACREKEAATSPHRHVRRDRLRKHVCELGKDSVGRLGPTICLGLHRPHLRNSGNPGMGGLVCWRTEHTSCVDPCAGNRM